MDDATMVEITMDETKRRYLSLLPDLPLWVETRSLLLSERADVWEGAARRGFVVWSKDDNLGSVVGEPEPAALARAAGAVSELLAFADNIDEVRSLLPDFRAEPATVFCAPEQLPAHPPHRCCDIAQREILAQDHLPAELSAELSDAAGDGVPVVASFDGNRPVAFAYVASETESLWDVSIDTLQSHRRRGYATAAVLHLMRRMKVNGKSAVWGAVDSNPASANLARRLEFTASDRLWVLTRSAR